MVENMSIINLSPDVGGEVLGDDGGDGPAQVRVLLPFPETHKPAPQHA